ncbi:MAG: bifunctional UDP-N-acetylglucosamine diphosphorylase/glucosamine-1-phosphate N-acetyltransferase GlmU [Oscillospiraceae bacterium]
MDFCSKNLNCIILAAGDGKRMHAAGSKVLCEVSGKPMLFWVIDAVRKSDIRKICVISGNDDVKKAACGCDIAEQTERLGTGHAVLCGKSFLQENSGNTLVLNGDAPFLDSAAILGALELHLSGDNSVTVIGSHADYPVGHDRIVRSGNKLSAIIRDSDCASAQSEFKEIDTGAYWFKTSDLISALECKKAQDKNGEYSLSETVLSLLDDKKNIGCFISSDSSMALSGKTPSDLLAMNNISNRRAIEKHLGNGVHFIGTDGVAIGPDVTIEAGATILPGCMLYGSTHIASGAKIGPNSLLVNVTIGNDSVFNASQGFDSTIGSCVKIGPYVHLRPDSIIDNNVKIGDFVEVKNSHIGEGTSLAHLTYIGDSDIGRFCNFGCGVVVVNYDGEVKNRTVVGDYAFIGCNTNLVAPVSVGNGAYTAAGTTVTHDVPDGALAVGRARQTTIEGWAAKKLKKYIEKKSK